MTDNPAPAPSPTPRRCINCGDRGYIGGRITLPSGDGSTRTPCYLCNADG